MFRARAVDVWHSGADGVYVFNFFDPHSSMWSEVGSLQTLEELNKDYFILPSGDFAVHGQYLHGGQGFISLPTLCPEYPETLKAGEPVVVPLVVDDGVTSDITLRLQTEGLGNVQDLSVAVNDAVLPGGTVAAEWVEYPVAPELLNKGTNTFEIALEGSDTAPILKDLMLQIRYPKEQ